MRVRAARVARVVYANLRSFFRHPFRRKFWILPFRQGFCSPVFQTLSCNSRPRPPLVVGISDVTKVSVYSGFTAPSSISRTRIPDTTSNLGTSAFAAMADVTIDFKTEIGMPYDSPASIISFSSWNTSLLSGRRLRLVSCRRICRQLRPPRNVTIDSRMNLVNRQSSHRVANLRSFRPRILRIQCLSTRKSVWWTKRSR